MVDLAWRLLRHGYDAVATDRVARAGPGADTYVSRLLGRRTLVVRGEGGARAFYDESIVHRKGAVPPPLGWLLFGRGAVHTLDGARHKDRKYLLVDILSADTLGPLVDDAEARLRGAAAHWPGRVVPLFPELVRAYGAAVQAWAGVPMGGRDVDALSRELALIVDGFGFAGKAYPRAWVARARTDRSMKGLMEAVRQGRVQVPEGSAVARLAARDDLSAHTAAVELINILRPTVAVAWLGTFAAVRLAEHPEWRERLAKPDGGLDRLAFAHEVRRTTPFAPGLTAKAHRRTVVEGKPLRPGDRMVLDIIGIDHDPRRWPEPHEFRPERFLEGLPPGAFDLVPQGGGHTSGHRCPGESLATRLLGATLRVLAEVDYDLASAPAVDRSRMPTLPAGGLRISVAPTTAPTTQ